MKTNMKRFIALLLVLCFAVPMAMAADTYDVTVTVSDGKSTLSYEYKDLAGAYSLFELLMGVADEHKAELKSAFPGHGFSAMAEAGVMAYISSDASKWTDFVNTYFGGNPLLSNKNTTVASLGTGSYSLTYDGVTFTIDIVKNSAPSKPTVDDQPSVVVRPGGETDPGKTPGGQGAGNPGESTTPSEGTQGTDTGDGPQDEPTPAMSFAPVDVTGVNSKLNTEDGFVYMIGDENGNFNPDMTMTRAQMCQIFYNLLLNKTVSGGILKFRDVADDAWYATAVNTLAALGIVKGVGNQTFEPDREITRAEFIAMCARFANINLYEYSFNDVPADHWGAKEINAAAAYGWIEADEDGNFRPTEIINRGEACHIMNRVLGRDSSDNDFTSFPDVPQDHPASKDVNEATGR